MSLGHICTFAAHIQANPQYKHVVIGIFRLTNVGGDQRFPMDGWYLELAMPTTKLHH